MKIMGQLFFFPLLLKVFFIERYRYIMQWYIGVNSLWKVFTVGELIIGGSIVSSLLR